ncbi:MAG TPA: hypothetical protein VM846_04295 [Vicinamibacterales bacterium]|jgi:hypothetical protein|nr:hypothetical protein [Vicinamibacterales bacterium]
MRALIFVLTLSLVALGGGAAVAQEGHPLKGSWIGTWTGNKVHGNDVLMIMNWDGKAVTGIINPGTDDIAIKSVTLDADKWTVHVEADTKDKAGPIAYVIDGKLENLAMHNRIITGTWKSQRGSGAFRIQRQ